MQNEMRRRLCQGEWAHHARAGVGCVTRRHVGGAPCSVCCAVCAVDGHSVDLGNRCDVARYGAGTVTDGHRLSSLQSLMCCVVCNSCPSSTAVASYTLFSLFRITSPYHVLWPAMISFPPSRHFRESLNFDWWEPAVRVRGAVDHHWVRHGMYMSDGGHTENLGVLPLLRLRAKRIVSVDAGADSTHACTSLLQVVDSVPRCVTPRRASSTRCSTDVRVC